MSGRTSLFCLQAGTIGELRELIAVAGGMIAHRHEITLLLSHSPAAADNTDATHSPAGVGCEDSEHLPAGADNTDATHPPAGEGCVLSQHLPAGADLPINASSRGWQYRSEELEDSWSLRAHRINMAEMCIKTLAMPQWLSLAIPALEIEAGTDRGLRAVGRPHLHANKMITCVPGCAPSHVVMRFEDPPSLQASIARRCAFVDGFDAHFQRYACGGVVMGDGSIVYAPCDAHMIWVTMPDATSFQLLSPSVGYLGGKYVADGALSPDGHAYFAPSQASQFLRVAPDLTWSFIGPHFGRTEISKFRSAGRVSVNGSIYFVPLHGDQIMRIHPGGLLQPISLDFGRLPRPPMYGFFDTLDLQYAATSPYNPSGDMFAVPYLDGWVLRISEHGRVDRVGAYIPYDFRQVTPNFTAAGVLNACGDVVFPPNVFSHFMLIAPQGDVVRFGGQAVREIGGFDAGGVLAPDGALYFVTWMGEYVARVVDRLNVEVIRVSAPCTEPSLAFISDGVLDGSGNVLFLPFEGVHALRIWPAC